ncbi:MAG: phage tail protein [Dehalococcoidia bacterium]|nr:phage tail protein [Dehalococcoidia bacterium]
MPGERKDPVGAFSFEVEAGGKTLGAFKECGGIGSETAVIEYAFSKGKQTWMHKEPGNHRYTNITLKRGVTKDMDLWDWRGNVLEGKMSDARRSCTITVYDTQHNPMAEWVLEAAWPCKLTGPTFSAKTNEIAVEELEIVHEGMKRNPI